MRSVTQSLNIKLESSRCMSTLQSQSPLLNSAPLIQIQRKPVVYTYLSTYLTWSLLVWLKLFSDYCEMKLVSCKSCWSKQDTNIEDNKQLLHLQRWLPAELSLKYWQFALHFDLHKFEKCVKFSPENKIKCFSFTLARTHLKV